MAKIDASEWKRFPIGSLFRIEKGVRLTRAKMREGDTPFIGATLENNGITAYVGNTDNIHPGGLMTVAYNGQKATGKAFFQPNPFWASDDVNVLYPKFALTEEIALFLAPLFWEAGRPYSFGDKWGKEVMEKDCIMLPVDSAGRPDWAYMDEYMSEAMSDAEANLENLNHADGDKHAADVSGWREFVIGDLFSNFVKPTVLHTRQVVETDEGIPYIVRTKFNNGIKCRVQPVDGVNPNPAGVITWGAENSTFFYQAEPFLSGRDIYYVDTREYSPSTCMFLTSCLQTITHKYPYNFGLFPDLLKEERIRLPADADGSPDWAYMGEYMRSMMDDAKFALSAMQSIG